MDLFDCDRGATIGPSLEFDAEEVATKLNKAVAGLGTDEDAIINILSSHTTHQRCMIADEYKQKFGKKLVNDLKDDLSGDFEKLVVDLFKQPAEYDVEWLRTAMKGIGTDESLLLEIFCTRNNPQIKDIRNFYKSKYGNELAVDLKNETSGSFKKLIVTLCNCGRDESGIEDKDLVQSDAEELLSAGNLKFGTDDARFNRIFCVRGFGHLRQVFDKYHDLSGVQIETSISAETSGDFEKGLLALVQIVRCKPVYFAQRLHSSMAGIGTKDDSLRRLVVSRCEIDMANIRDEFESTYGKTLDHYIRDDTKGDYRKLLLKLIGIRSA